MSIWEWLRGAKVVQLVVPVAAHAVPPTPPMSDADYKGFLLSLGFSVKGSGGAWRCGECSGMQKTGTDQVWIEDGAMHGDPMWSVVTRQRRHRYNGSSTAWCLSCCRSFTPMTAQEMAEADAVAPNPIPTLYLSPDRPSGAIRPFVQGMTLMPGESAVLRIPLSVDAVDPDDGDDSE